MAEIRVFRIEGSAAGSRGSVQVMRSEDLDAGDVDIEVAYSSVNYKDALAGTGRGPVVTRFPVNGGIDAAGRVLACASGRFQPGAPVLCTGYQLGTGHDGGYAQQLRVPEDWIVPLPPGLTLREAMALGTAGFTTALAIHRLECNGQTPAHGPIAVTGATGGVGSIAIDVLSQRGYQVSAISSKPDARAYLQALGAAEVLDRSALEVGNQPLARAHWGGAIDNVGGAALASLLRSTRPWGNVVSVGLAGGAAFEASVMPFILRAVALLGVTASGCPGPLRSALWTRLGSDLKPRHLERIVTRVVTLDELPDVFSAMLAGRTCGRTLVRLGSEP